VIALLRGKVVASSLGQVVVDVGGVGYRVHVPPGAAPPSNGGSQVTLHTHLAVREDAMTLYGFADTAARDLFETLLAVTGVGPKLALAALGTLGAEGLRRAVVTEDVAALTVVPGVGRKGAARIILELREKLGALAGDDLPAAGRGPSDARGEVREALAALGYAPAEVARTLDALSAEAEASPEDLLRRALQAIGSR
jgi:holliday junction DNA helicase RuvA